jgi:hypothetical protein
MVKHASFASKEKAVASPELQSSTEFELSIFCFALKERMHHADICRSRPCSSALPLPQMARLGAHSAKLSSYQSDDLFSNSFLAHQPQGLDSLASRLSCMVQVSAQAAAQPWMTAFVQASSVRALRFVPPAEATAETREDGCGSGF